jgi:hypothetical protein
VIYNCVRWLVVIKQYKVYTQPLLTIQRVNTKIINNTKSLFIVNKCYVYIDSFIVTFKLEADHRMEMLVTRWLKIQDTDFY